VLFRSRRVLTAAGVSEAVTFGFIEAKAAAAFAATDAGNPVGIANPLSAKFDTLRPRLLPGLVDAVAHNRRHGRRDVRLFEIGTRFTAQGETRGVGMAWTGAGAVEHWSGHAREVDFFDVKGLVELVCGALGVTVRFEPTREGFLVQGKTASVHAAPSTLRASRGAALGLVGQVLPALADARGLPRQDPVFVAELDLEALERVRVAESDATQPLPRYPFVVRDVSIVVADALPAEIIHGTIQAVAPTLAAPLVAVRVFDRYHGKGVRDGSVSLSLRLTFQAADRTLTDAEVQQSFDSVLAALVREHGAVQR
jgi:phenylalanyl-tRNA synthetase beta chain